jgi:cyanophycinase
MKPGTVLLIGGGSTPEEAVKIFIEACGGADAPLVILAHTQSDPAAGGKRSADFYRELGARNVQAPATTDPEELKAVLSRANGVWIPGGDQNRFTSTFPESTGVWEAIRAVHKRGGAVGGTSAGCSLMGKLMPTGAQTDKEGVLVGAAPLAPGLGVLNNAIADQHFLKRNRFQRLLTAILQNPPLIGIGVDELAWATLQAGKLTVRGGQVVILQARAKVRQEESMLSCTEMKLQVLLKGDTIKI